MSASIARQVRRHVLTMSHRSKAPHLGSSLSCVDILVAAYWHAFKVDPKAPSSPTRDRIILSKGHGCSTLYACLAMKGFFPLETLETFCKPFSVLPEHPRPNCVPGLEAATGSLGHGLSLGVGAAIAAKLQRRESRVCVVMSDGECNEGTVWEAAMMAPQHRLNNLVAVVDFNKWQATGRSQEVFSLSPLSKKWEAFGWDSVEVDGHDVDALVTEMTRPTDRPKAIVAHTVKGKGVSFMEDDNNWHYRIPSAEELELALAEVGAP